jgi:hypothetical protein
VKLTSKHRFIHSGTIPLLIDRSSILPTSVTFPSWLIPAPILHFSNESRQGKASATQGEATQGEASNKAPRKERLANRLRAPHIFFVHVIQQNRRGVGELNLG